MVLFARGDAEDARLLTARLLPRALRHAARVLGDAAEAEDVAQEAMMRLWRRPPTGARTVRRSLRPGCTGSSRTSPWTGCAAREAVHGAGPRDGADAIADTAPGVEARMAQADRMAALDAALASLPERQRQAVVLRHIEGLSNPEIAEVLEIGVEAVESLTARGKRALKVALDGQKEALGYGG
jgi:RNA polymerase sigma-70 factor (ECF subfamily)